MSKWTVSLNEKDLLSTKEEFLSWGCFEDFPNTLEMTWFGEPCRILHLKDTEFCLVYTSTVLGWFKNPLGGWSKPISFEEVINEVKDIPTVLLFNLEIFQ